eukprot:TRINITY_DN930_c0_g1_i2.p1 TRINITY_DN930_c0_g1~~TRINITY_DN930_c0_g1_i2.p1  ORF type:complete len:218 (-),score=49.91 TRINITY_DN930_c0_g1_i2:96-749(-)
MASYQEQEEAVHSLRVRSHHNNNNNKKREWVEVLSWKPRVFLYHNFITSQEAQHLIELGKDHLERSRVVVPEGEPDIHSARTSFGAWLTDMDPVVKKLELKIANWTIIPVENAESFYLLRYSVGEEYKAHTDFFDSHNTDNQRVCTVIIYLGEPEEGGETTFPLVNLNVPVQVGSAVLFWNVGLDGVEDSLTLHGSLPVKKGTKWVATKWLRAKKYN